MDWKRDYLREQYAAIRRRASAAFFSDSENHVGFSAANCFSFAGYWMETMRLAFFITLLLSLISALTIGGPSVLFLLIAWLALDLWQRLRKDLVVVFFGDSGIWLTDRYGKSPVFIPAADVQRGYMQNNRLIIRSGRKQYRIRYNELENGPQFQQMMKLFGFSGSIE